MPETARQSITPRSLKLEAGLEKVLVLPKVGTQKTSSPAEVQNVCKLQVGNLGCCELALCVLNPVMRTREYLLLEGVAGLNEKSREPLSFSLGAEGARPLGFLRGVSGQDQPGATQGRSAAGTRRRSAPPTRGRSPSNDSVQRVGGCCGGGAGSSGLCCFLPSTAQPPRPREPPAQASGVQASGAQTSWLQVSRAQASGRQTSDRAHSSP